MNITLDPSTDHETITVGKVTLTRGDIVTVGGSSIQRRVMAITDKWGARLVRIDGGKQAPSVWTKQYARIVVVKTVAEQEADAAAKAPKARAPRAPKADVVLTAEQVALLAEVANAADTEARNRAIVAAHDGGVPRAHIANAAGLRSVGRFIRAARRELVTA